MDIKIDIRGFDGVKREMARVQKDLRGQAMQQALNKVAEKARAEVTRAVTDRYTIKAAEVRASLALRRASAKRDRLEAVIEVFGSPTRRGRSMNMVRFLAAVNQARLRGTRASRKEIAALGAQLGFQVKKGGGIKQIPGVFIGNKGRTIFRRTGDARLPIEPVQVIGVSQMFSSREVTRRVMKKIDDELLIEVQRAVKRILVAGR